MRYRVALLVILAIALLALACGDQQQPPPASKAPEHTAAIRGKVVGRDAAANQLTLDGEKAGELMDAMTMPYDVRGARVADLPADGTTVTATLHEQEGAYWLTDVKPAR